MSTPGKPPEKRIGKYLVERVLGRGAMGVVYLARDPQIQRPVAVKTIALPAGLEEEQIREYRERFLREARAAGRLSHPAIVTIYECDAGEWGGPPFIAMEFIEGDPWNRKIRKEGTPEILRVMHLARDVASALEYAHSQGIVHRDIKPANIIEATTGHAKLMDFGIAKVPTSELTREGQFLGTPAYMSPEQVQGKPVDRRSDLFSFGTVLYELLTKKKPFPGEDITTVTHKILREEPVRPTKILPELPREVEAVILHLLEKEPDHRYQTAAQLIEDIDAYLGNALPPHAMHHLTAHSTLAAKPEPEASPSPKAASPREAPKAKGKDLGPEVPPQTPRPASGKRRLPAYLLWASAAVLVLAAALYGFWSYRTYLSEVEERARLVDPHVRSPLPEKVRVPMPPKEVLDEALRPSARARPVVPYYVPPELSSRVPAGNGGREEEEEEAKAGSRPCRLSYSFSSGILKGEFWLRIDGEERAHKVIRRDFTLKSETYSGTLEVAPGAHHVQFEVRTEIQDIRSEHSEAVEFPEGGHKNLTLIMTKFNKDIRFEWR